MNEPFPVEWVENHRAQTLDAKVVVEDLLPPGIARIARSFHRQMPGYKMSPLKGMPRLASLLGVGGIWIKDESVRLSLNSFKVLGGSFAMYRLLRDKLGARDREIPFSELTSPEAKARLGKMVFAAATDGNHGRGVAWAATHLGFESVIYVHKHTSQPRIQSIEKNGGRVVVVEGTYDDAVRQVWLDAQRNGWQVISDTSWEGYEDIPKWVMQGYN